MKRLQVGRRRFYGIKHPHKAGLLCHRLRDRKCSLAAGWRSKTVVEKIGMLDRELFALFREIGFGGVGPPLAVAILSAAFCSGTSHHEKLLAGDASTPEQSGEHEQGKHRG